MLDNDKQLINFIKEKSNSIAKRLKFKSPKILIDKYYNNCSIYHLTNEILFGLKYLKTLKNKNFNIEIIPPDTFLNRVYFVIAHELGHHLQFTKHRKWFDEYKKHQYTNIGLENYSHQKLENNASKIATILLKEYKKEKNVK